MDASAEGVERQLANRYSHPTKPKIAQSQNALAIGDNDDANGAFAYVAQNRGDVVALRVGDIQAARPAVDVAVVLARLADLRCIDDGAHLANMFLEEPIEQRFVAVLQRR